MAATIRRVAITEDDAEGSFSAAFDDRYDPREARVANDSSDSHGASEEHDAAFEAMVRDLRDDGLSDRRIAGLCGCTVADVEQAAGVRLDDDADYFWQTPAEAYGLEPDLQ